MNARIFVLFLFLFSMNSYASFENKGSGASFMATSFAGIASPYIDFASILNPAALQFKNSPELSFFYRNFYGLNELNQVALHGNFSLADFPLGCAVSRFGNNLYSESQINLATSYALDESVAIGIAASFYFLDIKNYSSASSLGLSLALIYEINPDLFVTAVVNNFNEPEIGEVKEALPVSGTLAFSFQATEMVELLVDVYKEDRYDFEYRFAAALQVIKDLKIMAGFRERINSFSAGLEYNLAGTAFIYSADFHPTLNFSHAIGIRYAF